MVGCQQMFKHMDYLLDAWESVNKLNMNGPRRLTIAANGQCKTAVGIFERLEHVRRN